MKTKLLITLSLLLLLFTFCKKEMEPEPVTPIVKEKNVVCAKKEYTGENPVLFNDTCINPNNASLSGPFINIYNAFEKERSFYLRGLLQEGIQDLKGGVKVESYIYNFYGFGNITPLQCDSGQFVIDEINTIDSTLSGTFWGYGTRTLDDIDTSYYISGSFVDIKYK